MKIFLSYDSEQFALAESINARLQAAGHEVFFDRDDLLAGDPFDARIAARFAASDAMIFLASTTSVAPAAYALSELRLAEQRWPRPAGRLIGVLLDGLAVGAVPAYLRSVSLLQPQGDVVAEVVHAVQALAARRRRRTLGIGAVVLAVLAALVAAATLWRAAPTAPAPVYEIMAAHIDPAGDAWRVRASLRNGSERRVTTVGLALEADREGIRFPSSLEWFDVQAGQTVEHTLEFELAGANAGAFQWRLCWSSVDALALANLVQRELLDALIREQGHRVCTPLRPWPAAS